MFGHVVWSYACRQEIPVPQDNSLAAEKVRIVPANARRLSDERRRGQGDLYRQGEKSAQPGGKLLSQSGSRRSANAKLVLEIRDIDYLEAQNEIDALLTEARLIKDILPKFNKELRDSKTFPYLEIDVREDYPRVCFTREPKERGTKLYGPFGSPRQLRGAIQVLQKIFKFRTCTLDIDAERQALAVVSSLPAALHRSMHRALQFADLERRLSQRHQAAATGAGRQERLACLKKCTKRWKPPSKELRFEEAARLRDEIEDAPIARQARRAGNARSARGLSHRSEKRTGRPAKSAAFAEATADHRRR